MEWCRLWPKRSGGTASTQTSNQTLSRWLGGANRPTETNAQNRCQSAERRVSVPGNSLVYPRRTPEFSQLDATIEWWRLWPKRNGGGGGIRTNGMLCVPLCYFGVFSALQALRNPRQTSSLYWISARQEAVLSSGRGTGQAPLSTRPDRGRIPTGLGVVGGRARGAAGDGGNGMDASHPLMPEVARVEVDPHRPTASKCQVGRASSSQANRRVQDED